MRRSFIALLIFGCGFAVHCSEPEEILVHLFDPPLNLTYGSTDDPRMRAVPMLDAYRAFFSWRTFESFEEWKRHLSNELLVKYSEWNKESFLRLQKDPSLGKMTSEQGAILYTIQLGNDGAIVETFRTHVAELPLPTNKEMPAVQILPVVKRNGVWQALPIGFEGDFMGYASSTVDRILKFADRIEIIRPPKKRITEQPELNDNAARELSSPTALE